MAFTIAAVPSSSVHRFLTGEQSLLSKEANPCWMEVCENVAILRRQPLLPTLDCINNPRWKGKNRMYTPENMDRVYMLDVWKDYDFADAALFGTAVDPEIQLCASDHYGVVVDIRW